MQRLKDRIGKIERQAKPKADAPMTKAERDEKVNALEAWVLQHSPEKRASIMETALQRCNSYPTYSRPSALAATKAFFASIVDIG